MLSVVITPVPARASFTVMFVLTFLWNFPKSFSVYFSYFINFINKTTTWDDPRVNSSLAHAPPPYNEPTTDIFTMQVRVAWGIKCNQVVLCFNWWTGYFDSFLVSIWCMLSKIYTGSSSFSQFEVFTLEYVGYIQHVRSFVNISKHFK